MKTISIIWFSFILFIPLTFTIKAQDIHVYNSIGEPTAKIIKQYGKPVFRDKSNPNMDCMFYKSSTKKLVFVSDTKSVYQAEATLFIKSINNAKKTISEIIKDAISNKYVIDTLSTNTYSLNKKGVKVNLNLSNNKYKNGYEVYLKAQKNNL